MNEPRDLIQRLEENPQCPGAMAKSFPCTGSSGGRAPRAICCVCGTLASSLREQPNLGDFWIPRTGLFAIGRAFFDAFDPNVHSAATSRNESAASDSSTKFAAA